MAHHPHLDDAVFEDLGLDHSEPAPRIETPYEAIMRGDTENVGGDQPHDPFAALSSRLATFRSWLKEDARCIVNPYLCIVNGEAHDGTKNAPVWTTERTAIVSEEESKSIADSSGRGGMIDTERDRELYDRGMGCCVMVTKEFKKEEVLMQIPRTAMITPDVVAASDAGRVALACCEGVETEKGSSNDNHTTRYWDSFEPAGLMLEKFKERTKASRRSEHSLVKILQERKTAESATKREEGEIAKAKAKSAVGSMEYRLAPRGTLSRKVPFLLFLIQQRFANDPSPPVSSTLALEELEKTDSGITLPAECPSSFGAYARTLPSMIPLPVCWRRKELALLAGCLSGGDALQEVTARTMQMVSEYKALLEAGILHRFPNVFPPGMITFERWMWADTVLTSRLLPADCYLNDGDERAENHTVSDANELQSPAEVWDDLGVMIPLLDMINHDGDDSPITWDQQLDEAKTVAKDGNGALITIDPHIPRARAHKRIKKHAQVYMSYGNESNYQMMIRYGFATTRNPNDNVKIGWSIADAVGNVPTPEGYVSPWTKDEDSADPEEVKGATEADWVFDSQNKSDKVGEWWTEKRLALLEREMKGDEHLYASIRNSKQLTVDAQNNGMYHPHLLVATVIATMPEERVEHYSVAEESGIGLPKRHREILQRYLHYFFGTKMEKLLNNLSSMVSQHYGNINLWTKVTKGGLSYVERDSKGKRKSTENGEECDGSTLGWQEFVNGYGIPFSIQTDKSKKYCALNPESCALFFYDGHLNALQSSMDALMKDEAYEEGVLRQLEELGFILMTPEQEKTEVLKGVEKPPSPSTSPGKVSASTVTGAPQLPPPPPAETPVVEEKRKAEAISTTNGVSDEKSIESDRRRRRKRNRRKGSNGGGGGTGDRPSAIKLHIGNLSYQTQTVDLFEYFARVHGRDNVLECHIPVERDTNRSRGFGFVTLPEAVAISILQSGRRHEIHGRILKVAESNSTGSAHRGRTAGGPPPQDRCARCGYRPKYCVCQTPDLPFMNGRGPHYMDEPSPHQLHPPPPRHDMHYGGGGGGGNDGYGGRPDPEYDYYGGGYRRERDRERDYSRSPSRRSRRDRDYDRDYRYRSRSRSFSRERGRSRRDRDRRGRSRSRERSRRRRDSYERSSSRRYSRSRSRSRSRSIDSDRSYSASRHRRRASSDGPPGSGGNGGQQEMAAARSKGPSPSRSASPPRSRRRRSRSRSRERNRRRRRDKKRERKHRSPSRSRSPGAASPARVEK